MRDEPTPDIIAEVQNIATSSIRLRLDPALKDSTFTKEINGGTTTNNNARNPHI
jgi:hypothetical protein